MSPIGIEIGNRHVRMLQLSHGRNEWKLSRAVELSLRGEQIDEMKGGFARDIEQVIREGLGRGAFEGKQVVLGLNSARVIHKHVRLPRMPAEELQEAVKWEAIQRFGFSDDTYALRFYNAGEVMQGNEERLEIVLFAIKHSVIDECIDALDRLGLNAECLEVGCSAMVRWMQLQDHVKDDGQAAVLVNLTEDSSSVVIHRRGHIIFNKQLDWCGHAWDKQIAREFDLSLSEARTMRLAHDGGDVRDEIAMRLQGVLREDAETLAREIGLCLRYYGVTFRGERPHAIVATGEECRQQWLQSLISEYCGIDLVVEDSLAWLGENDVLASLRRSEMGDVWAVACGAAINGQGKIQGVAA